MQMPDGTIVPREKGTPQGSPISPLLANLFMHYAFDTWMDREFPGCPFERYGMTLLRTATAGTRPASCGPPLPRGSGLSVLSCIPRRRRSCTARREPPGRFRARQLRFPRLHLPGPSRPGAERLFHWLQPGHQRQGEEGERPADQGLAPQPAQQRGPVRPRGPDQPASQGLDQLLRSLLPLRVALPRMAYQRASRPVGHAEIQAIPRQVRQSDGLAAEGLPVQARPVRPLAANRLHRKAGLWGPDDGRLSRPVLRAAGGETPPADSRDAQRRAPRARSSSSQRRTSATLPWLDARSAAARSRVTACSGGSWLARIRITSGSHHRSS